MSNRAERRAAKHRKPNLVKVPDTEVAMTLLKHCRPYDEGVNTTAHITALDAFGRLKDGTAEKDDFFRLRKVLNLAMVRACEIDEALARMLQPAHSAMNSTRERYEKTGKWGFDGPGMQAVADGLGIAQTIMDSSSPQQMINAEKTLFRWLEIENKQQKEQQKKPKARH